MLNNNNINNHILVTELFSFDNYVILIDNKEKRINYIYICFNIYKNIELSRFYHLFKNLDKRQIEKLHQVVLSEIKKDLAEDLDYDLELKFDIVHNESEEYFREYNMGIINKWITSLFEKDFKYSKKIHIPSHNIRLIFEEVKSFYNYKTIIDENCDHLKDLVEENNEEVECVIKYMKDMFMYITLHVNRIIPN